MINLLAETLGDLKRYEKTPSDVTAVVIGGSSPLKTTWDQFAKVADIVYMPS